MPVRLPLPGRSALVLCALVLLRPDPAGADSLADRAQVQVGAAVDQVVSGAQDLAVYALGLIGVRYRYGGEEPASGLDCSGLVRYVFQQVTGVTLPRTAREMSRLGERVATSDLQPGDLVFFNTRRFAFSHVGIYLGDGRFVHAPRTGRDVEIAEFDNGYWRKRFNGARRLAGLLPAIVQDAVAAPREAPFAAGGRTAAPPGAAGP